MGRLMENLELINEYDKNIICLTLLRLIACYNYPDLSMRRAILMVSGNVKR
jgi:hypothetical protein